MTIDEGNYALTESAYFQVNCKIIAFLALLAVSLF